jgi:hypothetical protein
MPALPENHDLSQEEKGPQLAMRRLHKGEKRMKHEGLG